MKNNNVLSVVLMILVLGIAGIVKVFLFGKKHSNNSNDLKNELVDKICETRNRANMNPYGIDITLFYPCDWSEISLERTKDKPIINHFSKVEILKSYDGLKNDTVINALFVTVTELGEVFTKEKIEFFNSFENMKLLVKQNGELIECNGVKKENYYGQEIITKGLEILDGRNTYVYQHALLLYRLDKLITISYSIRSLDENRTLNTFYKYDNPTGEIYDIKKMVGVLDGQDKNSEPANAWLSSKPSFEKMINHITINN